MLGKPANSKRGRILRELIPQIDIPKVIPLELSGDHSASDIPGGSRTTQFYDLKYTYVESPSSFSRNVLHKNKVIYTAEVLTSLGMTGCHMWK